MASSYDLPVEIFEQIFTFVQDITLVFEIANINYKLRYLATKEYFKRYSNIIQPEGIDIGDSYTTARALHLATWIKDVPSLTVGIDLDRGLLHAYKQVNTLTNLIRRLDTFGTLNIYITHEIPDLAGFEAPPKAVGRFWRRHFGALLNATLSKAVDGLRIVGPDLTLKHRRIDMSQEPPMPRSWRFQNWVVKRTAGLYSHAFPGVRSNRELMKPIIRLRHAHSTSTSVWGKASLKDLQIPPMLLTPLFFWDTIGLLSAHAHTIHTLNFRHVSLDFDHHAHWEVLLTQIQFPSLEHFTFTGPPGVRKMNISLIPHNHLCSFLNRHPKITDLELTDMAWGGDPETAQGIPHLPNLTTLIAHNYLAACILQRPDNCRHLQHLRLCSRSPGILINGSPCLPGCDVALAAVASYVPHGLKLELGLENAVDIEYWMSGQMSPRSLEIPRGLTHIRDITIFWRVTYLLDLCSQEALLNVLPNWLGLFPSLERICVTVADLIFDEVILRTAIRNSCPRLKSCIISGMS